MTPAAVTPTAIDAFVTIESVQVVGRHRKDLGNLLTLAASIADVDLINPITLTRDGRLVAGQRRLEACRWLGWDTIPARFIDNLDDAAKLLRAERDENTERKEMLPSEKASLGAALEEIERASALERQRQAGREHGRGIAPSSQEGSYSADDLDSETKAVVGEALGMGRTAYYALASVHKLMTDEAAPADERALAKQTMEALDSGAGLQPTVNKMRGALRAKREAQEAKTAALAPAPPGPPRDPDWIPDGDDRTVAANQRRRELVAVFAAKGYSSIQIGDRLGRTDEWARDTARAAGITIPADEAMGRGTRKKIDSNRIVRETVTALEGLELSLRLIRYDELDQAEIKNWADSLTTSIGVLRNLKKRLEKEMAQ